MTAADKIAEARALVEETGGHDPGPYRMGGPTGAGWSITSGGNYVGAAIGKANTGLFLAAPDLRDSLAALADLADAQAQENAKLRQIIAQMDAVTPRANKTCDQPGITLSEAIQREWPHLRVSTGDTQ